jgi:hypothetical protein
MSNRLATRSDLGGHKRKTREPETEEQRIERLEQRARERTEHTAAEDETLDAAVRRSIELYGA